MTSLEHDLEHAEIGLVFADVIAKGGVERNFAQLEWQLRCAQFGSGEVAVPV